MKKDKWVGVLVSAALHFDRAWNGMKPQRRSIRFSSLKKRKSRNLGGRKDVFQCAVFAHHKWTCDTEWLNRVNRGIHSGLSKARNLSRSCLNNGSHARFYMFFRQTLLKDSSDFLLVEPIVTNIWRFLSVFGGSLFISLQLEIYMD